MNRRAFLLSTTLAAAGWCGCVGGQMPKVVVYTSQDQIYADKILHQFAHKNNVEVLPLFDTESIKTTGLANRLRFEKSNPQCDLFWSNESMQTRLLAKEGVFEPSSVREFGYRTRRIVINSTLVSTEDAPKTYAELIEPRWKGKIALAYPLYGTTAYHFMALRQLWGDARWQDWCRALAANEAKIVDGNSMVVRLVGAGEVSIGLTDWDDIEAGKRNQKPITALPLTNESLAIPNTLALTPKGASNPNASRLADFLSSAESLESMLASGAIEGTDPEVTAVKLASVDWESPLMNPAAAGEFLKGVFLR